MLLNISNMKATTLLLLTSTIAITISSACSSQTDSSRADIKAISTHEQPVANFVVDLFEDSMGNLWFGTMSKGAGRYDDDSLVYLTVVDGLPGNTVADFAEDKEGNIWFATHSGLSKYDGATFTNYTTRHGLPHDRVSCLLKDSRGILWIGTWGGVCRYDGRVFEAFEIPIPDVTLLSYQTTMDWVTEIMEDSQGNIWFGRDGYGATKYNGTSFVHFTKSDGLVSNNIQAISEDKKGNIWFGTRIVEKDNPNPDRRSGDGGLNMFDGNSIVTFSDQEGLSRSDIYAISKDKMGNMWIGANGLGVYRYDGESFFLYKGTDRMDLTYHIGVQSILEDRNGVIWLGMSGGLFRLEGASIKHVPQSSLWPG